VPTVPTTPSEVEVPEAENAPAEEFFSTLIYQIVHVRVPSLNKMIQSSTSSFITPVL
jgi:hypothetical protein